MRSHQTHTYKSESKLGRSPQSPATAPIDFAIDSHGGGLTLILPVSPHGEAFASHGFGHLAHRWLGIWLAETDDAAVIIHQLADLGYVLRINGKVVS